MFKRFHLEVVNLKRVRLAFLTLGDLKIGESLLLIEEEIYKLKELTNLTEVEE